jgi:hypothetical protein
VKILIITHPRSGGKSLLEWISLEKSYKSYHEPNLISPEILNEIYNNNNIVVKILIGDLTKINADFNYDKLFENFNVIISHKREDVRDIAISLVKAKMDDVWHNTYEINNEWLETYNEDIEKEIEEIKITLFNLSRYQRNDFLNTTYESVYMTKTDIEPLCSILKIKNPNWLDMLDNKRKLRNGDIGMNNLIPTKRNII